MIHVSRIGRSRPRHREGEITAAVPVLIGDMEAAVQRTASTGAGMFVIDAR